MNAAGFFAKTEQSGWDLTEEQRAAVAHAGGPGIVFAGPGSGKTTVITLRAAYLCEVVGVAPDQITIFTFTRHSAEQLRTRLARVAPVLQAVNAGTFHSIFMKHLLRHSSFNPILLGPAEARAGMRTILRQLRLGDSAEAVDSALAAVSVWQTGAAESSGEPAQRTAQQQRMQQAIARYQAWKRQVGRCDFDDVITAFSAELRSNPAFAHAISPKLRHVLVDEFQDASPAEWNVVQMLVTGADSAVVVGDDDQAIYGFRGADAAVMRHFVQSFPNHQAYVLARNHRSRDPIIRVSRSLIRHNDLRRDKELHGLRGDGPRVVCRAYTSEWSEARAAAAFVARAEQEGASVAVLARTARQLYPVATVLRLDGRAVMGPFSADLFAQPVCRPVRDFLEAAACPQAVAAGRRAFAQFAEAHGVVVRIDPPARSIDAWLQGAATANPAQAALVHRFSSLLMRAANAALEAEDAQAACMTFVLLYERVVRKRLHGRTEVADLEVLAALQEFLRQSALEDVLAGLFARLQPNNRGTVQLLTFHAAKGLEFDRVCAVGLHDQALPHSRGLREAAGNAVSQAAYVQEERRLLYVGCTRAREMLALLHPRTAGSQPVNPSPFLREAGFRVGEPSQQGKPSQQGEPSQQGKPSHRGRPSAGEAPVAPVGVPALASIWSHRVFGDGTICSIEPMAGRGHKVGMRFAHGQVRYFLWEMSIELGHVFPLKGGVKR